MLGDTEMEHLPASMFQHEEDEQHFDRDGGHSEEIGRYHLTEMVMKKGLPRLAWWAAKAPQNAGDGALGDGDAEHLQFAMDPRCTQEGVGDRHLFDQSANLHDGCGSPPTTTMRFGQPLLVGEIFASRCSRRRCICATFMPTPISYGPDPQWRLPTLTPVLRCPRSLWWHD